MSQKLQDDITKRRSFNYYDNYKNYHNARADYNIFNTPENHGVNKKCCSKPLRYKNGIGSLVFWSCKNCGADLGDI